MKTEAVAAARAGFRFLLLSLLRFAPRAALVVCVALSTFIPPDAAFAQRARADQDDPSATVDGNNRPLVVGLTRDGLPPFTSVVGGAPAGLSIAMLDAALGGAHRPFAVRSFDSRAALLAAACRGDVDVLPDEVSAAGPERCLIFSEPYYQAKLVAVTRANDPAHATGAALATAVHAIDKASFLSQPLRERYPGATFRNVDTVRGALQAVASGKADVYVGLRLTADRELGDASLRSLAIKDLPADPLGQLRYAFPRTRAALRNRVDEGLLRINADVRARLFTQWIRPGLAVADAGGAQTEAGITLSDSERAFLVRLGPLKAAMNVDLAPFSYLDASGRPTGILPDYLAIVARMLGIRIEQNGQPSPAAEGRALASGAADLIVYSMPEQLTTRLPGVTQPVDLFPVVIVGRRDASTVNGIAELDGLRVAVIERSNNSELLRERAPSAIPVEVDSVEAALQRVSDGDADAMIGNLAAIDMLLQRRFAGDLKVLGPTGSQQAIGFQLRPEFAPLVPLMNRALAAVPEAERTAIRNRYLATHYELGLSWRDIMRRVLPAALIALLSIGILGVGYARLRREIRQRRQIEHALRTQLSFRSTLLDMVPFPIGVRDGAGVYIDVNAAAETAMGLPRDAVIGHTIEECVAISHEPDTLTAHILSATQGNTTYEAVRVDFHDTYGQARHGLYWHRPFLDDSGKVAGTVGAVVDVTALLEAERKAHETEARLEEVTHNLPASVFQMRCDASGALSYEYLGSNRSLVPDIQRGGLRLASDDAPLALPSRETQHLVSAIDESARSLRPLDATFRVGEEARVQWLKIRAVPRREADGATLFNGYWSDTTIDQLRAAELEAARIAAESASKAKDQFVAMMSHEIRTPMSGVLGLVELLTRTDLRDEQATMVGMVHESAGALLQILDDVLDYSKIQADRLTIEDAPVDIRDAADVVMGLLAMRAHQKSLMLRCRVNGGVAARHRGDSVRLRQILFNLIGNAIKFTESGTVQLVIDLEANDTAYEKAAGHERQTLRMTVSDTGIGIEKSVIPTLFTPFVQGESSTMRRFGGTGLGLVICRKLVTLMGGDIAIHSEPGQGTAVTVRVTLPVQEHQDMREHTPVRALVCVRDAGAAAALADALEGLGQHVQRIDAAQPAATPESGRSPADIAFVDEDDAEPSRFAPAVVIRVTERPEAAGYRISNAGAYVSINPLSFRGLRAICDEALTRDEADAARVRTGARVAPEALVSSRTRDEAIRDGVLILVAEDNPVNRYLIRSQLESFGCVCDITEDGAEALAASERNEYALLITDCQMPRVDGYTLASTIRDRERSQERDPRTGSARRLPIVALTATVGSPEWNRCIDAGMDDYLCKPAQRDVLYACLMRWAPQCLEVTKGVAGDEVSAQPALPLTRETDADLPPFDWNAINRAMGGTCRNSVLIEIVVESLHSEAKALAQLLDAADVTLLRQWIHKMRGAATMLRYPLLIDALNEFATIAKAAEQPALLRAAGRQMLATLEKIAARASQVVSETDAAAE